MLVLLIDLETTDNKPVEIGMVAYHLKSQCIVGCFSTLLYADAIPEKAPVHRIPHQTMQTWGWGEGGEKINLAEVLKLTAWTEHDFDFVIAHNAKFERQYIDTTIPWLCTYRDFDLFPPDYEGKRDLISLAQWHGVGVSVTHRAIYDCLLMAEVFNRVPNLRQELDYALLPKIEWLAPLYDKEGNKIDHQPPGFTWDYDLMGWIGKTSAHATGTVFFPVGDRLEVMVEKSVSFQHKDAARQWGFKWDGDRKIWSRLVNPAALPHFPFPLASVGSESQTTLEQPAF